jgi:hypothetical protein
MPCVLLGSNTGWVHLPSARRHRYQVSLFLTVQVDVITRQGLFHSNLNSPELAALGRDARPIESVKCCKPFELSRIRYVAYLVIEQCVGSCGGVKDDRFSGNLFCFDTNPHCLKHLAQDTDANSGPVQRPPLTNLNGRAYPLSPVSNDHSERYSDMSVHRIAAFSLNLTKKEYSRRSPANLAFEFRRTAV